MENLIDLCIDDEEDQVVAQHFRIFERADSQRNQIVKKLCHEIQDLKSALAKKTLEYDNEVQRRRSLEARSRDVAAAVKDEQQAMEEHNHALVLLDGNVFIFHESLLQKGFVGGAEAAYQLHNEIQDHLQKYDGAQQWKIVVRLYIGFDALYKTLKTAGVQIKRGTLQQFSHGFTQHHPLFDLVDIKLGRSLAEQKMTEIFKLSIGSLQCQHIVLGFHHYSHLTKLLQPYEESVRDLHRITLLKTLEFEVETALKSFNIVKFPSVFKSTNDFAFKPEPSLGEYQAHQDLTEDSESSTVQDGPDVGQSSNSSISDKPPNPQPKGISSEGAPRLSVKKSSTWNPHRAIVLLNLNDERIDAALGKVDPEAERSLKKRSEHGRPCHDFHIRGVCYTVTCPYSHEPRLSPQETLALRNRARLLPCIRGSSCRSAECWYGHMCPQEDCHLPSTCRFLSFHGMDRTAVTVWQRSGQRAWAPRENHDPKATNLLLDDFLRL